MVCGDYPDYLETAKAGARALDRAVKDSGRDEGMEDYQDMLLNDPKLGEKMERGEVVVTFGRLFEV